MISSSGLRYFQYLINKEQCILKLPKSLSKISLRNRSESSTSLNSECSINKKVLKIAIVGVPNAGKSTLINQIVERKVFPISQKVHTTRFRAKAVFNKDDTQLVFLDTPGLVTMTEAQKYNLDPEFICGGEDAICEADVIGVIHDLSNTYTQSKLDPKVLRLLYINRDKESFLVMNKIDTVKSKKELLRLSNILTEGKLNQYGKLNDKRLSETAIAEAINKKQSWQNFSDVFMISALLGNGVIELKNYLLNGALPGNWLFPDENIITDQTEVRIIEETVRSAFLEHLPQEIPYNVKIELEYLDIDDSEKVRAVVLVTCKTERLLRLIKGTKGARIKEISMEAHQALSDALQKNVFLRIEVVQGSEK